MNDIEIVLVHLDMRNSRFFSLFANVYRIDTLMFNRSVLSQDFSTLWDGKDVSRDCSVEVHMVFEKNFPTIGGTTGRMKYILVHHHNECHLRDEITLYMKRYGIDAKFIMKVGQDLMDDITYNRCISEAYKNNRVLRIMIAPMLSNDVVLSKQNVSSFNRRQCSSRSDGVIDLTLASPSAQVGGLQKIRHVITQTSAPTISQLSKMPTGKLLHNRLPTNSAAALSNSSSHPSKSTSSGGISTKRTTSHTASLSLSSGLDPIVKTNRQIDRVPQSCLTGEPQNIEILRRHEARNLRDEHEQKLQQLGSRQKIKVEPSSHCVLCSIDIENDESILKWVTRYETMQKRSAADLEYRSTEEWRVVLRERLGKVSQTYFVRGKSPFFVHLGCAEISWEWQLGEDMERVVQNSLSTKCDLCREFGASCVCSQPNCEKAYHTSCALFSPGKYPNGIVSFGLKPDLRRCPKCPLHREHSIRSSEKGPSTSDLRMIDIDQRTREIYRSEMRKLS